MKNCKNPVKLWETVIAGKAIRIHMGKERKLEYEINEKRRTEKRRYLGAGGFVYQ